MRNTPESPSKQVKPIHLIPVGGLGNRIRFLNSAIDYFKHQSIIVIDICTDMFPGRISKFVTLPEGVKVKAFSFQNEKALLQMLKLLSLVSPLSGGRVAAYGSTNCSPKCRLLASFRPVAIGDIAYLPLRGIQHQFAERYNAVHIRGTDNQLALTENTFSDFEDFIAASPLRVYVASDSNDTKHKLRKKFGEKVFFQEVGLDRENEQHLEEAFNELLHLISAQAFMPSKRSSFSTIAQAYRQKAMSS